MEQEGGLRGTNGCAHEEDGEESKAGCDLFQDVRRKLWTAMEMGCGWLVVPALRIRNWLPVMPGQHALEGEVMDQQRVHRMYCK